MKVYSFYMRPGADSPGRAIAIKEGFSWPALLFGFLWAAYHRHWFLALVLALIEIVVLLAGEQARDLLPGGEAVLGAVAVGMNLLVGLFGNDLRRVALERRGYVLAGLAAGRDRDNAEQRFLDSLVAGSRPAASR